MGAVEPSYGRAATIDGVIDQMDEFIARCVKKADRLGYFASLYRMVTIEVKAGIARGLFEDGARMERMDVIFANRYLDALNGYLHHEPVSRSWHAAFQAARYRKPLVLQHLLLGMNAHINLDLGIAAAQTGEGLHFPELYSDFTLMNQVLASLVYEVSHDLDVISPAIGMLDRLHPPTSQAIIHFSMEKARECAWSFAKSLNAMPVSQRNQHIRERDREVARLGRRVAHPRTLLGKLLALWVRLRESGDIAGNIRLLNERCQQPEYGDGASTMAL
ncbi:hypothetical protein B5M42_001865 [Paenibacillus athensensis]|uniref:Uncharacterized protein n=1 Tax=Paenibacillus athensensis TaxID=1967502 RepID=A0A4Y8QB75_9BACL|nr:DUF5995 family protein [Paenibacillus athensensis]MCD1257583.1 hypothetical protein [Paenibacillus athensensis]